MSRANFSRKDILDDVSNNVPRLNCGTGVGNVLLHNYLVCAKLILVSSVQLFCNISILQDKNFSL